MGFLALLPFIFIPGYLLSLFFPWIRGFFLRVAFSIILSLSFGVVVSFLGATVRLFSLGFFFLIFHILFFLIFLFFFRNKTRVIFFEWKELTLKEKNIFFLFLILSFFASVFVAIPHFGYWWPIHGDEWWQVGTVQNVMEGKPLNTHPYLFNDFFNAKPGFSSYIGALMSVGGINPIYAWPLLPAINIFFITFIGSLFLFVRTKKIFPAVAFPIFLVALRSNAYALGWWFFVPSSFALFFVLVLFLSFSFWKGMRFGFLLAFFLFLSLFLIYAPLGLFSFFSFLPFLIPYRFLFGYARTHTFLFLFMFFIVCMLIFGAVYIAKEISPYREYWKINSFSLSPFIEAFFVPRSATFHFSSGSSFFDIIPLFLFFAAFVGCVNVKKETWKQIIFFGVVLGIVNVFLVYFFDISFLLFPQRMFYFIGILLAVCASIGVSQFYERSQKVWSVKNASSLRKYVVKICFLFLSILFLFSGYFTLKNGTLLYHLVEKEDLDAMEWLNAHRNKFGNMTIISNQVVGTLITPFTRIKSKISFLTSQNISSNINPEDILAAEEKNCEKKEKSIVRLKGDLIYAKSLQSCPFLEEIYSSSRVFIYLYRPKNGTLSNPY